MTSEEKVAYWVKLSDGDLKVAETLLKNRHYVYAGFMCHQVVEKIFKACYQQLKGETPPYIHNIVRLTEQSGFYGLFSEEQKMFLSTLNPLNIEARYPDYKDRIAEMLTGKRCKQIFEQTVQLQQWTKENILLIR